MSSTAPTSATSASPASLVRRSFEGAAWSAVAYGGSQLLRFANQLVLTRLLAPEYFGLMALVNVFLIGVNMFSDVGIGPNIVQSTRGSDRTFLNAAWTLQIVRGGLIWIVCLIGAWPFAGFYNDPRLVELVMVSGLAAVISGFNSTKMLTAYRDMEIGRVTVLELGSQVLTVIFTIAYAAVYPSVWALVFASLFGALVRMLASHWWLRGPRDGLSFDRESFSELVRFGRWIFIGTMIAFVSNSAASMILGKFISVAEVGIFSLAVTLANIAGQAYEQLSSKVVFPLYSKLKQQPFEQLKAQVRKVRIILNAVFLPGLWFMAIFGQWIIELLLDPRYKSGGWILQLFSACTIPSVVAASGPFYLAMGNSFLSMVMSAVKLVLYLGSAFVGWHVAGPKGIICGMALHSFLVYLVDVGVQRHYRITMLRIDFVAMAASALVIGAGLRLTGQI